MSPLIPTPSGASRPNPSPDTHEVVASYTDYAAAQGAVDLLSDREFDIRDVRIVGRDMASVEVVTGRMTNLRATIAGAMSGAWFGLFVGLLLGLFVKNSEWVRIVATGIALGAAFGSFYGLLSHALTRGKRDFASMQALVAGRYDVLVERDRAAEQRTRMSNTEVTTAKFDLTLTMNGTPSGMMGFFVIHPKVPEQPEVDALDRRIGGLLEIKTFPSPNRYERSVPWPPV